MVSTEEKFAIVRTFMAATTFFVMMIDPPRPVTTLNQLFSLRVAIQVNCDSIVWHQLVSLALQSSADQIPRKNWL